MALLSENHESVMPHPIPKTMIIVLSIRSADLNFCVLSVITPMEIPPMMPAIYKPMIVKASSLALKLKGVRKLDCNVPIAP